jgi:hypothetical protein
MVDPLFLYFGQAADVVVRLDQVRVLAAGELDLVHNKWDRFIFDSSTICRRVTTVQENARQAYSHSIVNKPFFSFIFNGLFSCQMVIP